MTQSTQSAHDAWPALSWNEAGREPEKCGSPNDSLQHRIRSEAALSEILSATSRSQVRLITCHDLRQGLRFVQSVAQRELAHGRMMVSMWETVPEVATMLDRIVLDMAEAAQAVWPAWYGNAGRAADSVDPMDGEMSENVLAPWYRTAASECRAGRRPIVSEFIPAVQTQQLALAIAAERFVHLLAVDARQAPSDRLIGLSRTAEWLAHNTGGTVLVLVHWALANGDALDAISFQSLALGREEPVTEELVDEKQRVYVWPAKGRPHPSSPGEQLLAKALRDDAELRDLFEYNEPVDSVEGHRFLVDLLWRAGKLVIEVDGYAWHRDVSVFSSDRQRDYELLISGYVTLRVPHHEVVKDPLHVVQKIRRLVTWRRQQSLSLGS